MVYVQFNIGALISDICLSHIGTRICSRPFFKTYQNTMQIVLCLFYEKIIGDNASNDSNCSIIKDVAKLQSLSHCATEILSHRYLPVIYLVLI